MKNLSLSISLYLHTIKSNLPVNKKIKKAFINELKDNINQYRRDNKNITINDIKNKFGTPEDILISFNDSYDYYKNKSNTYNNFTKIITLSAIALTLALIIVIIVLAIFFSETSTM